MLGLSLPKILILALIVAIIWYWSKGLRSDARSNRDDRQGGRGGGAGGNQSGTETLVACPVCKAYVVEGSAKSCGRPDCPYKG
jgi:hypothetical protein